MKKHIESVREHYIHSLFTFFIGVFFGILLAYVILTFSYEQTNLKKYVKVFTDDKEVEQKIELDEKGDIVDVDTEEEVGKKEEDGIDEKVEYKLKVYMFSMDKFNEPNNSDYNYLVERSTGRKDVAAFTLEEIIKGPTASEKTKYNLESTFGESGANTSVVFTSESDCGGKDFAITVKNGLADIRFCRDTSLAGDTSGFIVENQIAETMKQFSTIDSVRIQTKSGNCFNDMRGQTLEECIL